MGFKGEFCSLLPCEMLNLFDRCTGRGSLVNLWDRDVPFMGIIFAYFFYSRVSKENNYSGAGCQNMSKGDILLNHVAILSNAFDRLF